MLRDRWQFQFTASKLCEAAKAKKTHHEERLKWWEEAKAKVMTEVRETGIEVSECVAEGYTNKSRGFAPQVMVRNDLQSKLTECYGKILEHNGKINEYDGWIQVFGANLEARLDLNADDYLFFFGR